MKNELFLANESTIITLDVDSCLFKNLQQITLAGFKTVEINTSDAELLQKISKEFPQLRLGAGNIVTTTQLESAYLAGIHFASSPGFLPSIAQTASIYSINYLPGIATISEAMQVMALGYLQGRPYPTTLSFCTLLNKCLPTLRLFPAEIEWDEMEHYLSLPSVAAISTLNPDKKQLQALAAGAFA